MRSTKFGKVPLVSFPWHDHWYTCMLPWRQSALLHLCQGLTSCVLAKAQSLVVLSLGFLGSSWHCASCNLATLHDFSKGMGYKFRILTKLAITFSFGIQGLSPRGCYQLLFSERILCNLCLKAFKKANVGLCHAGWEKDAETVRFSLWKSILKKIFLKYMFQNIFKT